MEDAVPRRGASVTQADIARAARALRSAGVEKVRIVFRPEGISVEADDGQPSERENRLAQRTRVIAL
ncbi:hypothetical protein [Methylobacterium sp. B1]|uniref:hypothetical protein n=1 Tax=Methylobacterium sp. B1 TaxID=91459 RepID=UPI0005BCD6BA|nr:hypothetical protein [Methylobacterium sp. B1]